MPIRKIVVINGSGGCGKSTFIRSCIDYGLKSDKNIIVMELSTVDYVKQIATYCGWNGSKEEKDRAFLHDLKIALEKWNNSPNQKVFDQIKVVTDNNYLSDRSFVFFVNIREPESIEKFIKENDTGFEIETLLVRNPNAPLIFSNEADANVENYTYDIVLTNDKDLENWDKQAQNYIEKLI